jgi:hypothetical protein
MNGPDALTAAGSEPRLRLEVLVSFMPTPTCMKLMQVFQDVLRICPDKLRLDVYKAGEQPDVAPTEGFVATGKRKKVPSAFVNGRLVASAEAPSSEAVEKVVREELERGSAYWR